MNGPTAYPDLNRLLDELVDHSRTTFGVDLVGVYLVGSFAVGDADEHSDCDFLVVVRRAPAGDREDAVGALWAELPTRAGSHWHHDLEGSYAVLADLEDLGTVDRPWLYVDRGHTEPEWGAHDNVEVVRWTLRERGVVVAGPEPASFAAVVPAAAVRDRMRTELPGVLSGIQAWAPMDIAWTQCYLVATCCRVLYSLVTGEVGSKRACLRWAAAELDPRWRPLLEQVAADRALGWDPATPPRPGSLDAARAFAAYAVGWGAGR